MLPLANLHLTFRNIRLKLPSPTDGKGKILAYFSPVEPGYIRAPAYTDLTGNLCSGQGG